MLRADVDSRQFEALRLLDFALDVFFLGTAIAYSLSSSMLAVSTRLQSKPHRTQFPGLTARIRV
ncbi:MAG: hypothetical protein M0008_09870 [Actinomycetota bacterium]|jgi:hypothetical protein|nr:hypothetical protein [Actinomycetota bacterium]